jgi:N-succinyldiaminopimelate aminotransferase
MSALAAQHGAVNLGQGFPDFDGPTEVLAAAKEAIDAGHNQYALGRGVPVLREAIAAHQQRFWDLTYDPETEIVATAGATEAIFASLQALLDTGDEVVVFEPFYDSYLASISMAGATARPVTLRPPEYRFDHDELRAAITPRTRVLLLNSPHNPTGAVFPREDLELLADLASEHDIIVVTDEVYEHLVFDEEHIPFATLPGMRDRTVAISSAAKTFSVTGWKIGWLCAPSELAAAVLTAKQFVTFVNGTPFQHAVATGLDLPDDYFTDFVATYRGKRDRLCAGLTELGLDVFVPAGTYFVTADIRPLGYDDGLEFCRMLPKEAGVAAVPTQVFYVDPRRGRHLVRFAFCKTDEVLDEGVERLRGLRP